VRAEKQRTKLILRERKRLEKLKVKAQKEQQKKDDKNAKQ
jgi:hypothetical protein